MVYWVAWQNAAFSLHGDARSDSKARALACALALIRPDHTSAFRLLSVLSLELGLHLSGVDFFALRVRRSFAADRFAGVARLHL
mgnify:CR=1 FL=1